MGKSTALGPYLCICARCVTSLLPFLMSSTDNWRLIDPICMLLAQICALLTLHLCVCAFIYFLTWSTPFNFFRCAWSSCFYPGKHPHLLRLPMLERGGWCGHYTMKCPIFLWTESHLSLFGLPGLVLQCRCRIIELSGLPTKSGQLILTVQMCKLN